jgi:pyridoxal 5'-phosphate synthase pdxT subunit
MIKIGILAVQGAFIEHANILKKLGVDSFEIRQKKDLNHPMDGLILPGGESTTMGKLLRDLDLFEDIKTKIIQGLPVFGTCAGMILLAKKLTNQEKTHFEVMDITVERNAYGRQLGSFYIEEKFNNKVLPMTFIRAPYITQPGSTVEILSVVHDRVVAAKQKNMLATAFHPELTESTYVHEYFIQMILKK